MGVTTSKNCPGGRCKERRSGVMETIQDRRPSTSRTTPEGANDADDVVFHVGQEPQMRISARKEVLSRRNDVFHAMFYGPYAESQRRLRHRAPVSSTANAADVLSTARVDHIYEPDVEGRAFKNLLSYLNGEKVELRSVVTAVETLHAAEKYLCHGLLKDCVQYLASQLTIDNVLPILRRTRLYTPADDPTPRPSAPPLDESSAMAVSLDNTEDQVRRLQQQQQRAGLCSYLLDQCLEFIDTNASGVLASEEFEELDRESVELIVCRDDLRIRNEVEVLMALLRWSVFECHRRHLDTDLTNQRLVLDDLIWQVRYLTMSADDLWKTPILSQLLTPHECSSLIGFTSGRLTVEELPPHLRRHLERMQTKRLVPWTSSALAPAAASAATCSQQVESRKSCVTEKIFVCLACIFE